jgi:hypothetical protein
LLANKRDCWDITALLIISGRKLYWECLELKLYTDTTMTLSPANSQKDTEAQTVEEEALRTSAQ